MAIDAYVKFGKTDDTGGPNDTPLPKIEGDSTDADHYWWCELRDCGFDLSNPHSSKDGDDEDTIPPSHFEPVTLKKRVDWATTQLFLKCCQAAEATTKNTDVEEEDDESGVIDEVEVNVCRPRGGSGNGDGNQSVKYNVVRVIYYNVRITHFEFSIDGPEPTEEIKFEFDSLDYYYQPSDPDTGEPKGDEVKIRSLTNHSLSQSSAQSGNQTPVTANTTTAQTSSGGGGGGNGSGGSQSQNGNGSGNPLVSTTESIASSNLSGWMPLTGPGTLS